MMMVLGLSAAVVATSFISGILSMAGGMILMGILLATMSVGSAMIVHGVTQLASNGWRAILWRQFIDRRIVVGYDRPGARRCPVCAGVAGAEPGVVY